MPWPTMQDYQEAIQNPHFCFDDEVLQKGTPVTDRLGLPKPISGGFATVFQMNCAGDRYAVRCFLSNRPGMEQRYNLISSCLNFKQLPCMVRCDYIKKGIRFGINWFPILKMEWIDADPFNTYIEKNLNNPQALLDLTHEFSTTLSILRQHSIAHGDLQHGNILVSNGKIRLVDYDGMFVPGMDGELSLELGHRNYQHPRRSFNDFGAFLDNFSAWTIATSLVSMIYHPDLRHSFSATEEHLVFRKEDFEDPDSSDLFITLKSSSNATVKTLVTSLESIARNGHLSRIPSLPKMKSKTLRTAASNEASNSLAHSAQSQELSSTSDVPNWMSNSPRCQEADRIQANKDYQEVQVAWLSNEAVSTGSLKEGIAAIDREDYQTALRILKPLAEQGEAEAQRLVGTIYYFGGGVKSDWGEAVKWLLRAAEQGDATAQSNLFVLYSEGHGVPKNHYEAVKWCHKAAVQGIPMAQYDLGRAYYYGEGVQQDYRQAAKWLYKAAVQGNALAQCMLGEMFFNGLGLECNLNEALKWYRMAADQGLERAYDAIGLVYESGQGLPQNYSEAMKWYRKAAEQGFAEAQVSLAWMYQSGYGTTRDYVKAMELYREAAKLGNIDAQYLFDLSRYLFDEVVNYANEHANNEEEAKRIFLAVAEEQCTKAQYSIGESYRNEAIAQNDPVTFGKAVKWFRRAAVQGLAEAQEAVGAAFFFGTGVTKDERQAAKWLSKAAEQGNAPAQYLLGRIYCDGLGVREDKKEAVKWFLRSAQQEFAPAQYKLGQMHAEGLGVRRDQREAEKWLRKAAEQGHTGK